MVRKKGVHRNNMSKNMVLRWVVKVGQQTIVAQLKLEKVNLLPSQTRRVLPIHPSRLATPNPSCTGRSYYPMAHLPSHSHSRSLPTLALPNSTSPSPPR